jgi:hypothetical protein
LNIEKIMFVNFEVEALEKRIKLKGTEGPHVSHHDVFRRYPGFHRPQYRAAPCVHPCPYPLLK